MTNEKIKTLISTDWCYEELCNSEGIDKDKKIEFSQSDWEEEKKYFIEFLEEEIKKYESRYKTEVIGIALVGTVGVWTGNHFGGKVYDINNIERILQMEVDKIKITINTEDREIVINGYHHDGVHRMKIHFVTKSKLKKSGLYSNYDFYGIEGLNDIQSIEKLGKVLVPLKLSKSNGYFDA